MALSVPLFLKLAVKKAGKPGVCETTGLAPKSSKSMFAGLLNEGFDNPMEIVRKASSTGDSKIFDIFFKTSNFAFNAFSTKSSKP